MTSRTATRAWARPVVALGLLTATILVLSGLFGPPGMPAHAQTPPAPAPAATPAAPEATPDYASRVVAYIYDNEPVSREELGEFLIARYGQEKLEILINKKIIEHACREKGIDVTPAEIEADLQITLGEMNVDRKTFLDKVLAARHLTLYEWKEDVVRPKLLLTKLCRDRIHVEDQDVKEMFESRYGEKIEAQVIIYPKDTNDHVRMKVYEEIRKSAEAFDREARQQGDANLARAAGHIKPICRHVGVPAIEHAAFALQPGEISAEIGTPQGDIVIIKCLGRIAPEKDRSLEKEREALSKEVFEKKLQLMIPVVFKELQAQAKPKALWKSSFSDEASIKAAARKELKEGEEKPANK